MRWTLGIVASVWLSAEARAADDPWAVERAVAWARVYGHVRWFHPSDEASALDLDRWACHGARVVAGAADPAALRDALDGLLAPVAPGARAWLEGEAAPPPLEPPDHGRFRPIAWQHLGMGQGGSGPYVSVRSTRTAERATYGAAFGNVSRSLDAVPLRGRTVRLTALARVEAPSDRLQLWLRVDGPDGAIRSFDNMDDRPITAVDWGTSTIEAEVSDDAERLSLGGFLLGRGAGWLDGFALEVHDGDAWTPVELPNAGFEDGLDAWRADSGGYAYDVARDAAEGRRAVRVAREVETVRPPFDLVPAFGAAVEGPVGAGVVARVPLVLLDGRDGTWPAATAPLPELPPCDDGEATRVADVVVAWNVFQHFYPYFDVVDADWDGVLRASLARALDPTADPTETLRLLVAALGDGHGAVSAPERDRVWPAIRLALVEDRVVVVASADPAAEVGDVVVAIDGEPVEEAWARARSLVSGSPQWKDAWAPASLVARDEGEALELELERDGARRTVRPALGHDRIPPAFDRPHVVVHDDGVIYVDLNVTPWAELEPRLPELAAAPGVVFDLRTYPTDAGARILEHLITTADDDEWMAVARTVWPDHARDDGWESYGWSLRPVEPHVGGKVAWLVSGEAISYAESVLGFVEAYGLGDLVGGPSAGTNGNVNPFPTPSGHHVSWTGMRVTKHDGSTHHLVGVLPTVPVAPTLEGVRAGRDEVLERGLEVVRSR